MNKLIDKDHERIVGLFGRMAAMLKKLESHHEEHRPLLRGERYLTDRDVSQRLRISRRTLQDYRNDGRISYIMLGGKVLYRESDLERMLDDAYRPAFRKME